MLAARAAAARCRRRLGPSETRRRRYLRGGCGTSRRRRRAGDRRRTGDRRGAGDRRRMLVSTRRMAARGWRAAELRGRRQRLICGPERLCKCLQLVCVTSVGGQTPIYGPERRCKSLQFVCVTSVGGQTPAVNRLFVSRVKRRGRRVKGGREERRKPNHGKHRHGLAAQATKRMACRRAGPSRYPPPPPRIPTGGGGWRAAEPRFSCRRGKRQTAMCGPHPTRALSGCL